MNSEVAQAYDWTGVHTVVDVGVGTGSLIAAILQADSDMRGTLLDHLEVLGDADHLPVQGGVRERCNLIGRSFIRSNQCDGRQMDSQPGSARLAGFTISSHFATMLRRNAIYGRYRDSSCGTFAIRLVV